MAFSALSMSYKTEVPNLDALQHYQQALPSLQSSLRTEQDLTSDGVFLTHFILLLYEVKPLESYASSAFTELNPLTLASRSPLVNRGVFHCGLSTSTNYFASHFCAARSMATSLTRSSSGGLPT